ncbi:MFS transporter [Thiothrix nivea]|uniref:Major facilitator superfamily MFS_1 n=1 Tax=Thiothrix nivea (strain ATCC 35100 / DSM 5205 / JP2) TaxID=870187 RepID=A0A656HC83_THINJ|nr:MFS transporter [Thiothrix nivea]EIJ33782.1 major facilitator superfamily MFS_1 [Thiothrix nivea DSM 5205]
MPNSTNFSHNRQRWAWAFYDWANSAFILIVATAFFPIFFRKYWAGGLPSGEITLHLGTANAIASLSIMLLAPFLGAIADQGGIKKPMMAAFVTLGVGATLGLSQVGEGQWQWAMAAFILAIVGFLGANIFYDSLLVDVAEEKDFNRVSALGFAVGYLGSGLLFVLCVLLTLKPAWFGLVDNSMAVRWAFGITAVWWAVFSIPLWLWVKERRRVAQAAQRPPMLMRQSFRQLLDTFRHIRQLRVVGMFLLAYWFYIDGVDTVILMSVDYGKALGFADDSLITALLLTQFIAFPAALVFGWLGNRLGAKRGILIALAGYVLITLLAVRMQAAWEFYLLAGMVGLVQGGVQALSRSLYASLIPAEQATEFFGFYNMLGKFAAVLGPLLVGWVGVLTGSPRLGLLAVLVLFALGALLLWRMPERA